MKALQPLSIKRTAFYSGRGGRAFTLFLLTTMPSHLLVSVFNNKDADEWWCVLDKPVLHIFYNKHCDMTVGTSYQLVLHFHLHYTHCPFSATASIQVQIFHIFILHFTCCQFHKLIGNQTSHLPTSHEIMNHVKQKSEHSVSWASNQFFPKW